MSGADLVRLTPFIDSLSKASGIAGPGLRLLIGLLVGYPFAWIYRFVLPKNETLRHLFVSICGMWVAFFCYEWDFLHSFGSIFLTWLILLIIPNRKLSLTIGGVGNFAHLLLSYWTFATENYDIDFTTAQSVLTLRLIGLCWDYYDGSRPEAELEHDQKLNGLKTLPSILETLSYCYFFGGFLIGPQFPFRLYKQFSTGELFRNKEGKERLPSTFLPTLRVFSLGALYLGIHNALNIYFPPHMMVTNEILNNPSFLYKCVFIWIATKNAMSKYLGVWLIGEGPTTLTGLNYSGYTADGKEGSHTALSNVKPWKFETALNLTSVIESFNINTNDWVKRYVFKRLKFLNNRDVSSFTALFFLAIWHGFSWGYFLSFSLEYVDMEIEKKLGNRTKPLVDYLEAHKELVVLKWLWVAFCWLSRSCALHYAMISFELKSWSKTILVYNSIYWLGHVTLVVLLILDVVIPRRRTKKE